MWVVETLAFVIIFFTYNEYILYAFRNFKKGREGKRKGMGGRREGRKEGKREGGEENQGNYKILELMRKQ